VAVLFLCLSARNPLSLAGFWQLGLSALRWDPQRGAFVAHTFNFHLFPVPYKNVDVRFLSQVPCPTLPCPAQPCLTLPCPALGPGSVLWGRTVDMWSLGTGTRVALLVHILVCNTFVDTFKQLRTLQYFPCTALLAGVLFALPCPEQL